MKKKLKVALYVACPLLLVVSLAVSIATFSNMKNNSVIDEYVDNNSGFDGNDEDDLNEEVSRENIAPSPINKKAKVFLPNTLTYEDGEYINSNYDSLPVLNNDTELQALGESVYENINGKTINAYSYYRFKDEAKNNPNVAIGLLLYQTIQYKMLHEEEDITVSFSSYRISPVASVCVVPQSRYYGYMRALYDKDYDGWGFVRISYLLVECARMGIEVNVLGQQNAGSVYQYNDSGKLVKRAEPSYVTYFTNALDSDCYDYYAPNKKVMSTLLKSA